MTEPMSNQEARDILENLLSAADEVWEDISLVIEDLPGGGGIDDLYQALSAAELVTAALNRVINDLKEVPVNSAVRIDELQVGDVVPNMNRTAMNSKMPADYVIIDTHTVGNGETILILAAERADGERTLIVEQDDAEVMGVRRPTS